MSRPELSSVVYVRFYDVSCLYESFLSGEGECVLATESRQVRLYRHRAETNMCSHYMMRGAFMTETIAYFIPCGLRKDGSILVSRFLSCCTCNNIFILILQRFREILSYAWYRHECHVPREANMNYEFTKRT